MAPSTPNGSGNGNGRGSSPSPSSSQSIASRTFTIADGVGATGSKTAGKAARRIHVAADVLKQSKIAAGEPLLLANVLSPRDIKLKTTLNGDTAKNGQAKPDQSPVTLGYAWPSFSLDKQHVQISTALAAETGLSSDDIVSISPIPDEHLHEADSITIRQIDEGIGQGNRSTRILNKGKGRALHPDDERAALQDILQDALISLGCVMTGQMIRIQGKSKATSTDSQAALFKITAITTNGKQAKRGVYAVSEDTEVKVNLVSKEKEASYAHRIPSEGKGSHGLPQGYAAVGGLGRQIAQIRELVELPLTRPDLYTHFGLSPPKGILLHGPPGTGKTLLASSIAASLRLPLFQIDGPSLSSPYHGETEQRLRDIFTEAQEAAPSIIVIDEIDALVPAREDAGEVERRVVATLLTLMDGLGGKLRPSDANYITSTSAADTVSNSHSHIIVIAATNRPNAIDAALRRPGRFDREIEVGVPDADDRYSILQVLLKQTPHAFSDSFLKDAASRTHGYVGADLQSLVHSAGLNAIRRLTMTGESMPAKNGLDLEISPTAAPSTVQLEGQTLNEDDLLKALLATRPSALRSVFLETPQVSWSDIGGQSSVKRKLQEVIEWPLRHPEAFKRLGITPPRGVLLYGPPGCSKTLIARALAASAGTNFIALKGPEIFNKYVGESERSVRETFRKARAAAPCIIFLDEIDVIAVSRDDDAGGSGAGSDRILTTLLTEMDGIEELNGVTVLAATNRPDVIDSALMRPGRLDRILYVAPPDTAARCEIFAVNFRKMAIHEDVDMAMLAERTEGCSGAEIVSICQDAAFNAMNEDINIECIRMAHFEAATSSMRRRITPEMITFYEAWRDSSGVREA